MAGSRRPRAGRGSAGPASANDRTRAASAGLGPYVTPAAGVIVGAGVTGTATVVRRNGTAEVEATVRGLQPGSKHAAHLHLGSCVDLLGHFRYDPNGPGSRGNEVWLDLTASHAGRASARTTVRAVDLTKPLSVVVHQDTPTPTSCWAASPATASPAAR